MVSGAIVLTDHVLSCLLVWAVVSLLVWVACVAARLEQARVIGLVVFAIGAVVCLL